MAEACGHIPACANGGRWVLLSAGVTVRISDLRALADGYGQRRLTGGA
jgi:hypothetical protein